MGRQKIKKQGMHIICVVIMIPIVILAGIRIVDLCYYNFLNGKNPVKTMQNSIGLNLPESAQIQEYQYNKDGAYYIKIEIDANDIPVVRERLSTHFDREFNYDDVDEKNRLDFSTCKWWDMEKYNVEYAYAAGITSHGPRGAVSRWGRMYMSVTEWAFLVKASQEKEYLYISAYLSIKLPEEKN